MIEFHASSPSLSSCVLNFNNITGPGVVVLPLLYAQAGWFLPTLGLLLMWLASSFAATMLCEAQQRVPGNRAFQKRYEYCELVRHYYGERWHLVAQVRAEGEAANDMGMR